MIRDFVAAGSSTRCTSWSFRSCSAEAFVYGTD